MANNMNTFTEIVFPPLPKSKQQDYSNLTNQEYWFQFRENAIDFMCKCPECGTVYCYSSMKPDTDTDALIKTISNLTSFYKQEWEYFCPDKSTHDIKYERQKGYDVYDEYKEDAWDLCSLR